MNTKYKSFIFEDYEFDPTTNTAKFHYSFDGRVKFTETISGQVQAVAYNKTVLDRALFALWIMAGVSYYKAYAPPEIIVNRGELNTDQKEFFDSIYVNGLAQFFYTNQLDWKNRINFPALKQHTDPVEVTNGRGGLVALGGGKDSIVAAELMNTLQQDYSCWVVNHAERFTSLAEAIGQPLISVTRQLDPELLKLNEADAYRGEERPPVDLPANPRALSAAR